MILLTLNYVIIINVLVPDKSQKNVETIQTRLTSVEEHCLLLLVVPALKNQGGMSNEDSNPRGLIYSVSVLHLRLHLRITLCVLCLAGSQRGIQKFVRPQ